MQPCTVQYNLLKQLMVRLEFATDWLGSSKPITRKHTELNSTFIQLYVCTPITMSKLSHVNTTKIGLLVVQYRMVQD